jgi:hypothetical protein
VDFSKKIEGCGRLGVEVTLYRLYDRTRGGPRPIAHQLHYFPCGWSPDSQVRGIALCEDCRILYGFPPFSEPNP